ncbi:MAG: hypothetical protein J6Q95_00580, partial [Alistipes sp.]|nr:hypothetical protein [Alistipes sp.]
TGGTFTTVAKEGTNAALINDDLEWTEAENGNWTLTRKPDVAKIGEVGYTSLQKAFDAVEDGETIVVENNITITEGINNNGVSYTRGASFTLDLNGQTVTSNLGNNALRFKIGDGNDVTNTNVTIEIKNGTVISGDSNWCAISAATASNSENKLTINLNKVTVYNSKAGDYGVKAWEGATINAKDVTINATKCAGGFYAVGGEIVLDNCTVNQKGLHTSPYMSMAIGVSSKGKLTVNSGNYSTEPTAAAEGNNQGTSHGSWCAGVMSSGGELTINGGTFANGNFGDDALATAARECVMVDAYGTLTINGGTFNALKKIIYIINNTSDGAIANPVAYVNGGDFSADPTDNGGYTDPILPEGYSAIQLQNGRWTIGSVVAKVGETTYYNIDEAIAAWTNNTTLTLLNDVTLNDVVTLKSTEHHILNLSTYTLTAASGKNAIEITCEGLANATYALTINADATTPGGINAPGKACIYYKKSGSTKDRPIILINNGVFSGSYSINSTSNGNTNCPQFWINGGVFNNNVNLYKNLLKITGGTFHGWINCAGDGSAYRLISGGRFKSWQFMTADAPKKFAVSTKMSTDSSGNWIGTYDVGVYVDKEGYLVVGGPVITEETRAEYEATYGVKFANKTTYSKWSSYLKYSSAAEHGLYYTNENWLKTKETDAVSDSTVEE